MLLLSGPKKMPLVQVGADLALLDGPPSGVLCGLVLVQASPEVPCFFYPVEVPRLFYLNGLVVGGCRGHFPVHLLVASAGVFGFVWATLESG